MRGGDGAFRLPSAKATCILLGAGLLLWIAFAYWVFPWLLERSYRGEGLSILTAAMGNRDQTSVDRYLDRWAELADAGVFTLIGAIVFAAIWARRGLNLDRHWFTPGRLSDLALARIACVGFQLFLLVFPSFPGCSGCSLDYQLALTGAEASEYAPLLSLKALLAPFGWGTRPDMAFLETIKIIGIASGTLALLGLLGRWSVLGLAWAATTLVAHSYSYGEYHHAEGLLLITLWALGLSPSHRARTLLGWLRARSGRGETLGGATDAFATWPLRLTQWLFAASYFDAGASKLLTSGVAWFQPTTLAYYFARDGIERGFPVGVWLSEHTALLSLAAIAAVGLELALFLAVLMPRLAPAFVVAMTGLHASIYVAQAAPFPQHIVLLWVAFLPALRRYGATLPWRGTERSTIERTLAAEAPG